MNLAELKRLYPFDHHASGAWCIWLTQKDSDRGLKLYFRHGMDNKVFLGEKNLWLSTSFRTVSCWKFATEREISSLYDLSVKLYQQGLFPKPHKILKLADITGIVFEKASRPPQKMYENKENLIENYHMFEKILGTKLAEYKAALGRDNWGLINGKLVLIDLDLRDLQQVENESR